MFILFFCPHIRHPKRRENASPHVLPRSHLVTETPPIIETVLWLIVMFFPSIGCRQPPRSVFFHFIFRRSNRPLKRRVIVPPRRSAAAESLSHSSPTTNADWWLVVAFSGLMAGHLRPTPCPSLSFFRPTRCPKTTGKNPPHALRLERISSPSPPPPPQPTFGWLSRHPIIWQPSKVDAPPTSLFFDGCLLAPKSRGGRVARKSRAP